MTLEKFKLMFVDSGQSLDRQEALGRLEEIRLNQCHLPVPTPFNMKDYHLALAEMTVCQEAEDIIRNSEVPWTDWREVLAEMAYPWMKRVGDHILRDIYSGPDGEKWGEADAWVVDTWTACHDVFIMMNDEPLSGTAWAMYEHFLSTARKKLSKYRRIFQ